MSIQITDVYWTRLYFELEYTCDAHEEIVLYRIAEHQFVHFQNERIELGEVERVHARINIVIARDRNPLDAGDWILCVCLSNDVLENEQKLFEAYPYLHERAKHHVKTHMRDESKALDEAFLEQQTIKQRYDIIRENPYDTHCIRYSDVVLEKLGSLDRVLRYSKGDYVYTATLIPRLDSTDYVYVVLSMGFYKRNRKPRATRRSIRAGEKHVFSAIASAASALTRKTGKRVLFLKTNGDKPTPNMAALRDRMFERGLDNSFIITERYRNVFSKRTQNVVSWLKDIRLIVESDYIFIDDYCPIFNFIKPKKGTVLTQVWHAGVGFKSVGYARFGISGSPHPYHSAHRVYTYALVGNEHLRPVYSEVFGIEQEALLATGMPRLDHFLDDGVIELARTKLYERYSWMKDGRVIVFAPTFRGSGQRSAYYPYKAFLDMEKLYDMCVQTNSFFVFEMHPFIEELPPIPPEFGDRLVDLSSEDLNELYHVSDLLVTDYSSCFYDYLLLEKPVVFYVPDKVVYSVTRGTQRTIDEMAPGVICNSFDELILTLSSGNYDEVVPDPSCLDRKIEGDMLACDRVIDTILLGKDVPGVRLKSERV